jgi:hypothetical protein
MPTIRCSNLPIFMRCSAPYGAAKDAQDIETHHDMANFGNSGHEAMQRYIQYGQAVPVSLLMSAHCVPQDMQDDLEKMIYIAAKAWDEKFADAFPTPDCERNWITKIGTYDGESWLLSGHPDVATVIETPGGATVVRGLDFKFGHAVRDWSEQMRGYAYLAIMTHDADRVEWTVYHARTGEYETYTYTRSDMRVWFDQLVKSIKRRYEYVPGGQCEWCVKAVGCAAKAGMARQTNAELTVDRSYLDDKGEIIPEVAFEVWAKVPVLQQALDRFKDDMKAYLRRKGSIEHAGQLLQVVDTTQEKLDPTMAILEAASKGIDPSEFCTPSKGRLLSALMERAERGEKKATADAFMDLLRERGGVHESVVSKFKLTAAPAKEPDADPPKSVKKTRKKKTK